MNKKRSHVPFYLLSVILAFLILFLCYLSVNISSEVPEISEYRLNALQNGATVGRYIKADNNYNFKGVAFYAEAEVTNIKANEVMPVLVNENFCDVYNIKTVGAKISEEMIENNREYVLISENLARKLFFNTDVIGKSVTLFDRDFTVAGIYKTDDSLWNSLSKDSFERVYIPYSVYENYENEIIDCVTARSDNDSMAVTAVLNGEIFKDYVKTDFSLKLNVTEDFVKILFMIFTTALCVIILKIWINSIKSCNSFYKSKLSTSYFLSIIKSNKLKTVGYIALIILLPLIAIFVFICGLQSIYIVPQYLPNENIFDISHYITTFVTTVQNANSQLLTGNPYYSNLYMSTFYTSLAVLFIAVFVWAFWYYLVKIISVNNRFYPVELSLYFAIISIVLIVASILSANALLLYFAKFSVVIAVTILLQIVFNITKNRQDNSCRF